MAETKIDFKALQKRALSTALDNDEADGYTLESIKAAADETELRDAIENFQSERGEDVDFEGFMKTTTTVTETTTQPDATKTPTHNPDDPFDYDDETHGGTLGPEVQKALEKAGSNYVERLQAKAEREGATAEDRATHTAARFMHARGALEVEFDDDEDLDTPERTAEGVAESLERQLPSDDREEMDGFL